jgi:transcriptional regulator with XRE-family HTH domain
VYTIHEVTTELATFGTLLKHCRRERNFSLLALAQKSGLTKTTLGNWESGRTQPSTPELESLFFALGLSAQERFALRRSIGHSRVLTLIPEKERPPLTGGLLRALRLRSRLSQSEVARKLDIRQGTLAKWEKSEDWPTTERLSALCAILRARPEEVAAILGGVFLPMPMPLSSPLEVLVQEVDNLVCSASQRPDQPLLDLRFLELESLLQFQGERPAVHELLWRLWGAHATFLCANGRYGEALPYTDLLLSLSCEPTSSLSYPMQVAVIMRSRVLSRSQEAVGANRPRYARAALNFLKAQEKTIGLAECQAWYWMTLGELHIDCGSHEDARHCIQSSNAIPHPEGERLYTCEAALITAMHLTELGNPAEALVLLDSPAIDAEIARNPLTEVRRTLYRAKALLEVLDVRGAEELIHQGYERIEMMSADILRPLADSLAFRLMYAL